MAAAARREKRGGEARVPQALARPLSRSKRREEDAGRARARQEAPDRFAASVIATQWPWLPACFGSSALAAHIV